ncbi:hypothetical protein GCM10023183_00150 [Nibribacter koreensis]|uniref:Uncharacterized protein n=2 Tax=Nibribacter koreensis TaxID=1084519 RepID=A0ABP8F4K1_9BACT
MVSLLLPVIALSLLWGKNRLFPYPDSIYEYSENGYRIRVEGWWNKSDSLNIKKYYISEKPYEEYTDISEIKWKKYDKH